MAGLRKMTMGEICEIADIPKETGRTRMKGLGWLGNVKGWARFDVPSTVRVAVHAEALRQTENADVAIQSADFVAEALNNSCTIPPFLVRRQGMLGESGLIFRRRNGFFKPTWCPSQEDALHEVGAAMADSIHFAEAAAFQFVNVSTLTDWALDRIFDLQGIDGNEAQVPQ